MRLVLGPLGPRMADHPARPRSAIAVGSKEAKRAFTAMMEMGKLTCENRGGASRVTNPNPGFYLLAPKRSAKPRDDTEGTTLGPSHATALQARNEWSF